MELLRAETLQCEAQVMDLAKWKLVAVAAVALAGLGWGAAADRESSVLLLYSGGLIAAYLDALIYRRLLSLQTQQRHESKEDSKPNEQPASPDRWIHVGSTVAVAVALSVLAFARWKTPADWRLIFPVAGVFASAASAWLYVQGRRKLLKPKPQPEQVPSIRLSAPGASTPPPIPARTSQPPSYLR